MKTLDEARAAIKAIQGERGAELLRQEKLVVWRYSRRRGGWVSDRPYVSSPDLSLKIPERLWTFEPFPNIKPYIDEGDVFIVLCSDDKESLDTAVADWNSHPPQGYAGRRIDRVSVMRQLWKFMLQCHPDVGMRASREGEFNTADDLIKDMRANDSKYFGMKYAVSVSVEVGIGRALDAAE